MEPAVVSRASHGASSTSTVFTGRSPASASFQLPTTRSIVASGRRRRFQ